MIFFDQRAACGALTHEVTQSIFSEGAMTRAGEGHAHVRKLVEAHFDEIGRFIRGLGVDEADVDDATQEVFLTMHRRIGELRPGVERSFLFGTAINVAAHARRSRARRKEEHDEQDDIRADELSPEDLLDERRQRERLDAVLDAMSPELRAVLVMSEINELTMREIAEILEVPAGTVASRLRRARAELESRLKRMQRGLK